MAKNRIIGVNGHLPWSIPKDRALFKRLTTGKVLILGRKSYEDEVPNGTHQLPYIRWCILVSTTADPQHYDTNKVKVARSFPEALDIAQTLAAEEERKEIETSQGDISRDNGCSSMDCWIGGGERIYEEALKHGSAHELHLSLVDTDIEVDDSTASTTYARFPAKYRWDSNFEVVSTVFESGSGETHNFTYYVYKRKKTLT